MTLFNVININEQGGYPKLPKAREGFGWLYPPHNYKKEIKKNKKKIKKG